MASKNFLGMFSCVAISEIVIDLSLLASATSALIAYFVFFDSISSYLLKNFLLWFQCPIRPFVIQYSAPLSRIYLHTSVLLSLYLHVVSNLSFSVFLSLNRCSNALTDGGSIKMVIDSLGKYLLQIKSTFYVYVENNMPAGFP